MKIFYDYFPIICFFIAYKWKGIYFATAVTIAASALQIGLYWVLHKRFEKMHLITFLLIAVLGGSTLIFHQAIFIQWKPSIIYWLFSLALVISHFFSKKNLIEHMLGSNISVPKPIWAHIALSWSVFFFLMGFINLYVVYHYSMDTWVNFKLFGTLGLTLVFAIAQAIYMSKHIDPDTTNTPPQLKEKE